MSMWMRYCCKKIHHHHVASMCAALQHQVARNGVPKQRMRFATGTSKRDEPAMQSQASIGGDPFDSAVNATDLRSTLAADELASLYHRKSRGKELFRSVVTRVQRAGVTSASFSAETSVSSPRK